MNETPEAAFDSLYVAGRLTEIADGVTVAELTLFCYLGCLLSVFDNRPPSEWGYGFASTKLLAPYSEDVAEAVERSAGQSYLESSADGYRLSQAGEVELDFYSQLVRFSQRKKYLRAACSSSLAVPLPQVGAAISAEPGVRQALALSSTRPLLDEGGTAALYEHFQALEEAIPGRGSLFVAAVTWISFLASRTLTEGTTGLDPAPHAN